MVTDLCLPAAGKSYEIVKRLQEQNNEEILLKLADAITKSDKDRGKKHQVLERSFDL